MMVSKKRQRTLMNTGRLAALVGLIQSLTQEMNRVVQLLRDDGISVNLSGSSDAETKKNDSPDGT